MLRAAARCLLGLTLLFGAHAHAAYDVTVALAGSTGGGAWSGNTWTANQSGATLMASEVQAHLASGPVTVSTGSGGSEPGDLTVEGDITWSANTLTLSAAHDITVNGELIGSDTAALALEYGQGAVALGNTGVYRFNTPVNLTSYLGDPFHTPTFSTRRGSNGIAVTRTAPLCPVEGRNHTTTYGCKFLETEAHFTAAGQPVVFNIEYDTVEINGTAGTDVWIYVNWNSAFPGIYYPYVMSCVDGVGKFYFPNSEEQELNFDTVGNITDLAGLNSYTTTTKLCQPWSWGPVYQLFSSSVFNHGYYLKYTPSAGEYGNATHVLPLLITQEMSYNTSYKVVDYIVNVRPAAPTATGAGDLTITAPNTAGDTNVTLAGPGALSLTATSSNPTLLPNAAITGASSCTAEGACTLAVAPTAGQYGSATVTVTATDAWGQQGSDSFTVTVLPPEPTVSGATELSLPVSTTGNETLTLTGTGALTLVATSSNTTLLPDGNIDTAGCTAAGICTLALAPVAGESGSATVTLTVEDAFGRQATANLTLDVLVPVRVLYDGNGSTSGNAPTDGNTYLPGDGVATLAPDLERTGYTFAGWNTKPDGSGTHYDSGDNLAIEGDVTLYAEWEPVTTDVSFGGGAIDVAWFALLLAFFARILRGRAAPIGNHRIVCERLRRDAPRKLNRT